MFVSERINVDDLVQDTPLHNILILDDSQCLQNFIDQFARNEATQLQVDESTESSFRNVNDAL